jgi:hypothetical protein
MGKMKIKLNDKKSLKKIERVIHETVVHRRQFRMQLGVWPFVVFGPRPDGLTVVRAGSAEQSMIQRLPVYIATLGDHVPDHDGVPIEEIVEGEVPAELSGLKVFNLTPLRPLNVTSKRETSATGQDAIAEIMELYKGNDTAVIETPDESFWALSVLKYLDESDTVFPSPIMSDFQSRLGRTPKGRNELSH